MASTDPLHDCAVKVGLALPAKPVNISNHLHQLHCLSEDAEISNAERREWLDNTYKSSKRPLNFDKLLNAWTAEALSDIGESNQILKDLNKPVDVKACLKESMAYERASHEPPASLEMAEPLLVSRYDVETDVKTARKGIDLKYTIKTFAEQHTQREISLPDESTIQLPASLLEGIKKATDDLVKPQIQIDTKTLKIVKEVLENCRKPPPPLPLSRLLIEDYQPRLLDTDISKIEASDFESSDESEGNNSFSAEINDHEQSNITDTGLGVTSDSVGDNPNNLTVPPVSRQNVGSLELDLPNVKVHDEDYAMPSTMASSQLSSLLSKPSEPPLAKCVIPKLPNSSLEDVIEHKHIRLEPTAAGDGAEESETFKKLQLLFRPDNLALLELDDDFEDLVIEDLEEIEDERDQAAVVPPGNNEISHTKQTFHTLPPTFQPEIHDGEESTNDVRSDSFVPESVISVPTQITPSENLTEEPAKVVQQTMMPSRQASHQDLAHSSTTTLPSLKRKIPLPDSDRATPMVQDSLAGFFQLRGKRFKLPEKVPRTKFGEILDDPLQSTQNSDRSATPDIGYGLSIFNGNGVENQSPEHQLLSEPRSIMVCDSVLREKTLLAKFLGSNASFNLTIVYRTMKRVHFGPDIALNGRTCLCMTNLQSLGQRFLPGQRSMTGLSRTHDGIIDLTTQYEHICVLINYASADVKEVQMRMDEQIAEFAHFCRQKSAQTSCQIEPVWLPCPNFKTTNRLINTKVWELIRMHALYDLELPISLEQNSVTESQLRIESRLRESGINPFASHLAAQAVRGSQAGIGGLQENLVVWLSKNVGKNAFFKITEALSLSRMIL